MMRIVQVMNYKPTLIEWTIIMRSFGGVVPAEVPRLFKQMVQAGVVPDEAAYSVLIRSYWSASLLSSLNRTVLEVLSSA